MADSAEPLDQGPGSDDARRYSAFISYSHGDERFARTLQRRLETYRLPRQLAKRIRRARLKPAFRDSDELSAGHDLTEAVRAALAQSDFLIVICSPRSAQSAWVGREIEIFRHLNGEKHILTALIDGEADQAIHPALRRRPHGRATEPLAADFRPGAAGGRMAFLKLIAPMTGVALDDLVHRDSQRRIRQAGVVAAGALWVTVLLGALTIVAFTQRGVAVHERNKAQALVGFMATDLRQKLRNSNNLDLLTTVNNGTLSYYRGEDLTHMTDTALQARAKLLQSMGEDDERRGDLDAARSKIEEAARTTSALLAKAPGDPQRIFDQAQSDYWIGFINWREGDGAKAKAGFQAYAARAARLVQINPRNDDWIKETAFAANNLGMLALRQAGDPRTAERQFQTALDALGVIARHKPDDRDVLSAMANKYAWIADCRRVEGDFAGARANREMQHRILTDLSAKWPRDMDVRGDLLGHDLAMARIEIAEGQLKPAIADLEVGHSAALDLAKNDPTNTDFRKQARMFELFKAKAWLTMPAHARPADSVIQATLGDCSDPALNLANAEIGDFCAVLTARLLQDRGDAAGAAKILATMRRRAMKQHDVLTAHWGIDLADETPAIQVAATDGLHR
ncbi:toll/interleukin-1 receptor domain-containing protein [Phenylobacterium sp.]|uniref:toll/interleukin-1 receptor domain-containing protein n=1 Tax=Phenylobacterium sp. TaxID=1871053 RepID=UPI0012184A5B|nr:toll/interleukin-1 receptor domain-containing protein [Phenylobacterium sp.]THD64985.1 MAG: toll/interleukin-1 receptor domain-containing protein [Phenylobacterium sp.]